VRHILKLHNQLENARRETESRLSILKVENKNLVQGPNLLQHGSEQNCIGTTLVIDEFYNLIFLFDILAPTDTRQFILIL
jgi:hypothetical protein